MAEAIDVYGDVVARAHAAAPGPEQVGPVLREVAEAVADGPFRLAVVSAADPVDRHTGRLVELPDAPFLLGALDVPDVLADLVAGAVTVDNDVNWAARAEARPRLRVPLSRRGPRVRGGERRRGAARPRRRRG